jgi:tripartite-type tricarboxylate transporter receptor subunit TctC
MLRRSLLVLGAGGAPGLLALPLFSSPLFSSEARADTSLPDKGLRILVGFTAGGGAELMARAVLPRLQLRTGRHIAIENKPMGSGVAAGEYLKKGLADGTVVAFLPSTTLAATLAGAAFPFDIQSELVPLTVAGTFQVELVVSPTIGVTTFADYVAWLKAGPPERARLGLTSTDAYLRIYAMMIGREIGLPLVAVPHQGAAPLAAAVRQGEIPAGLGSVAALRPHDRSGVMKVLMVSGPKRLSTLRTVPTAAELGHPNLELDEWYGFFAASVTPIPIAEEWSRQLRDVLGENEVAAALAQLGLDVETSTKDEAAARFAARLQAWKGRMESFGLKPGD